MKTYLDFMAYELDQSEKLIRTRWTRSLSSQEYRQGMLFVIEAIETHSLNYWLYDASRHSAPEIGDQIWMADVFTPLINQTTIKKVAAILPPDVILQAVAENIHKRSKAHKRADVAYGTFYDATDAKDWLSLQK